MPVFVTTAGIKSFTKVNTEERSGRNIKSVPIQNWEIDLSQLFPYHIHEMSKLKKRGTVSDLHSTNARFETRY